MHRLFLSLQPISQEKVSRNGKDSLARPGRWNITPPLACAPFPGRPWPPDEAPPPRAARRRSCHRAKEPSMPSPTRLMVADAGSGMFLDRVRKSPATAGFEMSFPEADTPEALGAAIAGADAVYCYMSRLSREVLRSAKRLKFIQKHGLTCKNIDLAAAADLGIPVATLPLSITVPRASTLPFTSM